MKRQTAIGILGMSGALMLGALFFSPSAETAPVLGSLEPFELTNQDKAAVSLDSLKGRVHVVNFIFTSCPGVCPFMTRRMVSMEEKSRKLKDKLHFVSISVDPETDTPEKLKTYAETHGANLARWDFLTGDLTRVQRVVVDGFKSQMAKMQGHGDPNLMQIVHGEHFILVDAEGRMRAFRKVASAEDVDQVLELAEKLIE